VNILADYDFTRLGEDPNDLFSLLLDGPLCLPQTLEILGYEDKVAPYHADEKPPQGFRLATSDEINRASLFTAQRWPFQSLPNHKESNGPSNTIGLEVRYIASQPDKVVVFPNNRKSQTRELMLYTPGPTVAGIDTWQIIYTRLYSSSNPGKSRGPFFVRAATGLMALALLLNPSPSTQEAAAAPADPCRCWPVSSTPFGSYIECTCEDDNI